MNKKVFPIIIMLSLTLTACGGTNKANSSKQNKQSSSTASKSNASTPNTSTENNSDTSTPKTSIENGAGTSATDNSTKSSTGTATSKYGSNNINNIKGFTIIENQSFMVDLNSWGYVRFVSGKLTGGNHVPVVFYLTNKNGDILYSFDDVPFPYRVDVKAVSFRDVNKDGLKDIIVIVCDSDNIGGPIAAVWLQDANKKFTCDVKIYKEINESGNNKDIQTVMDYLSKKF